jgi:hypothetical protein
MAPSEKLVKNAPKSSANLMALLKDGLDWPFPDNFEPEDVPLLEWRPSEIGLDESAIPRLKRIEQIPKLTDKQPFGVFILDFEKGRLPIGAIRRLVNRLVHKKRATKSPGHALWNLSDLIFFCQSHEKVSTVHVVAFRDTGSVPVMKVISWDTDDSEVKIKLTVESLRKLQWPTTSSDADSWREEWQGAFTAGYREGISSAKKLAEHMAEVAKTVRDEVRKLLAIESEFGPLRRLQSELKANLIADIDDAKFADMYAQTMVYGLLTARISHPEDFQAEGLNAVLKFENPFLDSLYSSFRKTGDEAFDVDEFGLHDLAETLGATNVEEVLADFGDENRKDDPVVFFYEDFLTNYDPAQRRELGAYYTPIPVVRFMVRAVDHIIKTEFDLPLGVADPTTWGEYSKAKKIEIPDGLTASDPVIRMIDPATGTGTFLLEWLRQAWANLGPKATDKQKLSVVERMDAFEISLSSYSVAHLKTGLELPTELRKSTRFDILLTDALAGPRPTQGSLFEDDPIAEEGKRAEHVKFERRHSVVIGNPPYLRVKSDGTGGWITQPSGGGASLFDDVLGPATANTIFSHVASLYNLYVYFWRWAIWKAFEQTPGGPSVVAFITASSWLDGPGFMGLRELARKRSTSIYVIDLGGEGHGAVKDEGVFPIQTPVSIVLLVRGPFSDTVPVREHQHLYVTGSRDEKLKTLAETSMDQDSFATIPGEGFDRLNPVAGGDEWASYPALIDLLPWQQPGCKYGRTWPISPSPESLVNRWKRLLRSTDLDDRAACFVTPSSGRNIFTRVGSMTTISSLPPRTNHEPIVRYGFRSFDRQWAFEDPRMAKTESPSLWESSSDRQVYFASFTMKQMGTGPAMTASAYVPDMAIFIGGHGGKDVIPLFRDSACTPNSDSALVSKLSQRLRLGFGEVEAMLPPYIFGLLAGTNYTYRFRDALQTPGPRVPLTANGEVFAAMAAHGSHLIWLQTYGERFRTAGRQDLKIPSSIRWKKKPTVIPADPKACSYDASTHSILVADGILEGVSPEVWAFEVSGMKVVPKWLGYRTAKGTGKAVSSKSPLDHIRPTEWTEEWNHELRELVHVLTETLDLLPQGVLLLDQILDGPLISADELPEPPDELRKPPKAAKDSSVAMDFE